MSVSAREYLIWDSLELFDARARKVAVTLSAIAGYFKRNPGSTGMMADFLDSYSKLRGLENDIYTKLVNSPEGYCWARKAYQELQGNGPELGEGGLQELCRSTMDEFKLLVVGAFVAEGSSVYLGIPCRITLPANLPVAGLLVYGEGEAEVQGSNEGHLVIDFDGNRLQLESVAEISRDSRSPVLLEQPTLKLEDNEIVLSPYVFLTSSIKSEDASNALSAGYKVHRELMPLVQASFEVLKRYAPGDFHQIVNVTDYIGVHDPNRTGRGQASLSDLPGTFIVPCYVNPFVNVECIIHEFYHNRLFLLEELDQVFDNDEDERGTGKERYFSPWRLSVRPIKGLLHSTFVFVPVARFWLSVLERGEEKEDVLTYTMDETVRQILYLRIGIHLLKKYGRYTSHGLDIIHSLDLRIAQLFQDAADVGIPDDCVAMRNNLDGSITPLTWNNYDHPVTVRETLRAHIERYDSNRDCRDLPFAI